MHITITDYVNPSKMLSAPLVITVHQKCNIISQLQTNIMDTRLLLCKYISIVTSTTTRCMTKIMVINMHVRITETKNTALWRHHHNQHLTSVDITVMQNASYRVVYWQLQISITKYNSMHIGREQHFSIDLKIRDLFLPVINACHNLGILVP